MPTILSLKIEKQIEILNAKKNAKKDAEEWDKKIKASKEARLNGDVAKMADAIRDNENGLVRLFAMSLSGRNCLTSLTV